MPPEFNYIFSVIDHQKKTTVTRCHTIDWNDTIDQTLIQKNHKLENLFRMIQKKLGIGFKWTVDTRHII